MTVSSAALLAGLLLALITAAAPVALSADDPAAADRAAGGWSDATLDAFAAAWIEVAEVQAKWDRRLDRADTRERRHALLRSSNREEQAVIRGHGLRPETFDRIQHTAGNDRDLARTLRARIERRRAE